MLCRDEAYRCFGVGAGCAEAGESRGGRACPRRGHTVRQSRAEGRFGGVFGMLRKPLRCRAAMSEMTLLRGRNDVGKKGK